MRLHVLIPTIPADLISALETCGIKTDTDLLFFPRSRIELLAQLPPGLVSLKDLERYTSLVAEHASAPCTRGNEELNAVLSRRHEKAVEMSSGVQELDALVEGFGGGRVFEISGDKGSGKTALALQISQNMLSQHPNISVLWMDTRGDFSVERALQMTQILGLEASPTVLERLQVAVVLNIEAAQNLLAEVHSSLEEVRHTLIML
ncbi:hypothetical protein ID866_8670 [Astraeus odoratus]|nr:hypothetical protein ID866_8670 [Astraeus odoratus]